jgi:hypothetical protein
VRFQGSAYRAHDPKWSFKPLSGDGAAIHGGRFNPKGTPALYVALDPMTAVMEAAQGFAQKILPCVLCTYEIDCEDVIDLRTEADRQSKGVAEEELPAPGSQRLRRGANRRPGVSPVSSSRAARPGCSRRATPTGRAPETPISSCGCGATACPTGSGSSILAAACRRTSCHGHDR